MILLIVTKTWDVSLLVFHSNSLSFYHEKHDPLYFLAGLGLSDVRRQDLLFRNVFHVFAVSNASSFVQVKNAVGPSLREAAQAMALVYQPGEGMQGGTTKVGALT